MLTPMLRLRCLFANTPLENTYRVVKNLVQAIRAILKCQSEIINFEYMLKINS